jgi:hypothetical protein
MAEVFGEPLIDFLSVLTIIVMHCTIGWWSVDYILRTFALNFYSGGTQFEFYQGYHDPD